MGQRRKAGVIREGAAEQEMRDGEVLRANRELAAYFRGERTEREARAALKIIKAFVRNREDRDARSRSPLRGATPAKTPKHVANRTAAMSDGERPPRKPRRTPRAAWSETMSAANEPPVNRDPPQSATSDNGTSE
jgi:hypothetical protein